jgi:hypothetical protein
MFQSDLAVALRGSAEALGGFKRTDYALIVRDLKEAESLLRRCGRLSKNSRMRRTP